MWSVGAGVGSGRARAIMRCGREVAYGELFRPIASLDFDSYRVFAGRMGRLVIAGISILCLFLVRGVNLRLLSLKMANFVRNF